MMTKELKCHKPEHMFYGSDDCVGCPDERVGPCSADVPSVLSAGLVCVAEKRGTTMCEDCEKYKKLWMQELTKREKIERKLKEFFGWIVHDILDIE